ncbi:MAG TPA: glycosyltransferase [Microcoleaceae cyanobacterium]|jgi:glycosyltransferase involved in cell wall biosynthesis/predicted O-methyltransferase YrrM
MMRSFSVIVPVLNKEKEIIRSLESVEASIQFFQQHYVDSAAITPEVLVIDEGSTDRTVALVTEFIHDKPHYKLIHHFKSLGIGPARNTGAKLAQGDILFFCDGDDLYYPEHIYLCFRILHHDPAYIANNQPNTFQLETKTGGFTIELPPSPVGIVRTGVYMADPLHPYWKGAIENTIAQNLCIRRDCHEFLEGFPEAPIYKQIGCEDVSYDLWIAKFFKVFKVPIETVEYIRYPGNNFDRQLKKFQTPPGQYQDEISPEHRELHAVRHRLEQEKLNYLLAKFQRIDRSPEFFSVLNWQQLAADYLAQQQYADVIALCEQGIALEPQTQATVKNLLAVAYNNLGSALKTQNQLEPAVAYFKQAIAVNPTFANKDLAKVHYNIASTLKDQNEAQQALVSLNQALELDPEIAEDITDFAKTKYQIQVLVKGYQFTQDWFSINLPVWEQYLMHLANTPELKVLEIGSWEGRSTCWLLDHILTHPTARLTCIDTFEGGVENKAAYDEQFLQTIEQRFDFNIARTGAAEKVRKAVGQSQLILRSLIPDFYHLVYIDGSHIASDVLQDTLLTWELVKVGGIIVFDDYGFSFPSGISEHPPRVAIDAFMNVFSRKIKLIHQGYQVIIEKTSS